MRALVAMVLLAPAFAGCTGNNVVGTQPAFEFVDTEGATQSSSKASGQPVVLFFMASWCGSCRATAPNLANVYDDFKDEGLQVFSIAFDSTDDDASLREWKSRYGQTWPHGVDLNGDNRRTFGITSQSSLVFIDAESRVVHMAGYSTHSESSIRSRVQQAFDASPQA